MKKCLVGLLCLGMAVTAALGDLSSPAPLPVNWAGESGYTTANIKAMQGWTADRIDHTVRQLDKI